MQEHTFAADPNYDPLVHLYGHHRQTEGQAMVTGLLVLGLLAGLGLLLAASLLRWIFH